MRYVLVCLKRLYVQNIYIIYTISEYENHNGMHLAGILCPKPHKIPARYVPIFHYVPKHTIIPAKNILNTCQKYTDMGLYVVSVFACTETFFMLQICSYWYIYDQFWSIVVCIRSYLPVYPLNRVDSAGTDAHTWQAIAGA